MIVKMTPGEVEFIVNGIRYNVGGEGGVSDNVYLVYSSTLQEITKKGTVAVEDNIAKSKALAGLDELAKQHGIVIKFFK